MDDSDALCPSGIAEKQIRRTFADDVTLGSEGYLREEDCSLVSFAEREGNEYFFENVRELFSMDDLTVVNLEGVFSDSNAGENKEKTYRFRGKPEYTEILTYGSVTVLICLLEKNVIQSYLNRTPDSNIDWRSAMILQSNEIISHYNDLPLLKAYHSKRAPFKRENTKHFHSAFEISLILGGKGIYQVGENSYAFCEGDIFLFSTNEIHCITEVLAGEDLHILNLQFEPRFVWIPGNDTFDLRYLDVFFHRSQLFRHQLKHDDFRSYEIKKLLMTIDSELQEKSDYYEMMVKNMLLTALVYIRRNYREYFQNSIHPHNARIVHQLNSVMQYIDEHIFDDLSIRMLAEKAHMSRSHFSALFCELNGISAWEYIINKRVAHAAHLLQSTEMSIMEIAMTCGFNTAANFNHAFKKQTNKSPTQYRKEMK